MSRVHTCDVCGSIYHSPDSEDQDVVICPGCYAWAASMGVE